MNHDELLKYQARIYDYDHNLIPNQTIRSLEQKVTSPDLAMANTGLGMGYPACNLLYYSVLCSLDPAKHNIVIETGTNCGMAAITIAQAINDSKISGHLYTVEISEHFTAIARQNIEASGVDGKITMVFGDSLEFLKNFNQPIDFAFLDSNHEFNHVYNEFSLICPKLAINGKIYFDNTNAGDVNKALLKIKSDFGGNLIQFMNCSFSPSGNAIWQR